MKNILLLTFSLVLANWLAGCAYTPKYKVGDCVAIGKNLAETANVFVVGTTKVLESSERYVHIYTPAYFVRLQSLPNSSPQLVDMYEFDASPYARLNSTGVDFECEHE